MKLFKNSKLYKSVQRRLPVGLSKYQLLKNRFYAYKREFRLLSFNPFLKSPFALAAMILILTTDFLTIRLLQQKMAVLPQNIYLFPFFTNIDQQFLPKEHLILVFILKNILFMVGLLLSFKLFQKNLYYLAQWLILIMILNDFLLFTFVFVYLNRLT